LPVVTPWLLLAIATVVLLLDRTTKALAVSLLSPARKHGALRLVINTGSLSGGSPSAPVLIGLWGLALGCALLALAAGPARPTGAGLAVALGGATGNLCDRLGGGAVVDFVALGWWPAFNLADVAIVAGVVLALGSMV
jgi:signal peptidase II